VIEPELFQAARAEQRAAATAPLPEPSEKAVTSGRTKKMAAPAPTLPPDSPRPEPSYTRKADGSLFDPPPARPRSPRAVRRWHHLADFVVGPSNRVAFAASQSVVESAGQGPNPLVIHGPVGTGKTHLLEGVYAGLRKSCPD